MALSSTIALVIRLRSSRWRSHRRGATILSCRSPARNVSVFQCPNGARPSRGTPRSGVMFVLVQVSFKKTERSGFR